MRHRNYFLLLDDKLGVMQIIEKYFRNLTDSQYGQFSALQPLYEDWNAKINVISRMDIGNLYEHHVLHSLAIARMMEFTDGTRIMDLGTGGGFPGIPLAILFPECHFTLVDSIGKKVRVAQAVAESIGLKNVECKHERAEEETDKFDFVVSRGVTSLPDLCSYAQKLISHRNQHNAYPNGVLCLKGGDLSAELAKYRNSSEIIEISTWFKEDYFKDKKVVYVQI